MEHSTGGIALDTHLEDQIRLGGRRNSLAPLAAVVNLTPLLVSPIESDWNNAVSWVRADRADPQKPVGWRGLRCPSSDLIITTELSDRSMENQAPPPVGHGGWAGACGAEVLAERR